ncbi:MAG TPA: hypothetical protein VF278_24930 [Pirellulales bacterium]
MKADDLSQAFRLAAKEAIESHDVLAELWRQMPVAETAQRCAESDIELLRQLIEYRIFPVNAFELLARIDLRQAYSALLSRYVGKGVSPDGKFGGYYFELSVMLDDLKEIGGEEALRSLIALDDFDRRKLTDPRVVNSFSDALDMEPNEFDAWLNASPSYR